jgi:integrase
MEDRIDVHNREREYKREMDKLEADENMNAKDKELILRFVWDCKMGKTQSGRYKKKIGKARILKYIQNLRILSGWIGKRFEEVTQEDMEKLVCGIEENVYKNREKEYSDETKADYKKTLRKFYKWLGKPELIEFISLVVKPKDVPAIKREEAETMINSTHDTAIKAAIIVLFDGGLRVEEFLNLRIKDLTKEKYGNDSNCYWIDVRYSKTFARKLPLPLSTKYLQKWLEEHREKENPDAQVFPFTYPAFRKRLKTLAEKALKKNVNPHMLRHSSATYWAPKMNRYQFCAKYGWSFGSDMPDRYIKRKGIIFDEIAEKGDVDQTSKLQKDNVKLREKMERLEQDYKRFRKALEFMMPIVMEQIDDRDFINKQTERTKKYLRKIKTLS